MRRALGAAIGAALVAIAALPAETLAQVRNWPSESQPGPLAVKPVAFPAFETRTLANGLRVVAVSHREQPAVSVRLLVGAGSAQDEPGKSGVANLAALMLDRGTATRSASQVADALDAAGGSLTISAGTDVTFAYATVLRDGFAEALDVLADVVRAPAFSEAELERERGQLRSALRVMQADPDYVATAVLKRLIYGRHPYGLPGAGTAVSVDRITRDDLVAFHRSYFVPNNCLLALAGDIAPDEAFAAAERAFGGWARGDVPRAAVPDPPAPAGRVVIVDLGNAPQTEIRAGHLAVSRASADYQALDLVARVLGGEGGNRLQRELREKRGLIYAASAEVEAFRLAGSLTAETETVPGAAIEALRALMDEFRRVQRDPASGREFETVKANLAGGFPLAIETPDAVATRILTTLFHGLPADDLGRFREQVSAVTAQEAGRVALSHVKPDRLAVVLVGSAAGLPDRLQRLGLPKPEVIPLAELDLTAPDLRRTPPAGPGLAGAPAAQAPPPMPGVSLAEWGRAKSVVMRAIEAAGGLDALRAVRTIRAVAETVIATPEGPLRAETETSIEYPGRVRVDVRMPRGEVVQVYDNGHAWIRDPTGPHDAPAAMREEFAQSIRRDWIALLLAAADDRVLGRRLEDGQGVGGRPLQIVELWGEGLSRVRVAVDARTGGLESISHTIQTPAGGVTMTESFSDFRPVRGVQVPYVGVVRRDGVLVLERFLVEIQMNASFPPAHFEKS